MPIERDDDRSDLVDHGSGFDRKPDEETTVADLPRRRWTEGRLRALIREELVAVLADHGIVGHRNRSAGAHGDDQWPESQELMTDRNCSDHIRTEDGGDSSAENQARAILSRRTRPKPKRGPSSQPSSRSRKGAR